MECGECTLCCELLPIVELNKPASKLCGHCVLKKGCSIYKDRPTECKNFDCAYIQSDDMPIELRPDNCNVIFEKVTSNIYLALSHYKEDNAWQKEIVVNYIKTLNDKGISVITTSFTNAPKGMFLAKGHTQEEIQKVVMKEYNNIK